MRLAVKSQVLPVYKKNRIASLLCIFETTIYGLFVMIVYQVINCLISQPKHMLWVLKRTAAMRRSF